MERQRMQTALDVLIRVKDALLENMVEDLIRNKDDDASSFSLQEIEDRFAIRLANLNTLIISLQDQLGHYPPGSGSGRIVTNIQETSRSKLASKLEEVLEFVSAEELLHLSVIPTVGGKFMIVIAHGE